MGPWVGPRDWIEGQCEHPQSYQWLPVCGPRESTVAVHIAQGHAVPSQQWHCSGLFKAETAEP